jgi:hypothetical protein
MNDDTSSFTLLLLQLLLLHSTAIFATVSTCYYCICCHRALLTTISLTSTIVHNSPCVLWCVWSFISVIESVIDTLVLLLAEVKFHHDSVNLCVHNIAEVASQHDC